MHDVFFVAGQTMPGFSPRGPAYPAAREIVVDQRCASGRQFARRRAAYRRALKGLDRHLLRDIGIDLGSA